MAARSLCISGLPRGCHRLEILGAGVDTSVIVDCHWGLERARPAAFFQGRHVEGEINLFLGV